MRYWGRRGQTFIFVSFVVYVGQSYPDAKSVRGSPLLTSAEGRYEVVLLVVLLFGASSVPSVPTPPVIGILLGEKGLGRRVEVIDVNATEY